MSLVFVGKRFYTNRDALRERYGRIYQLPVHWAYAGIHTRLWLIDYHTREQAHSNDGALDIVSTPALSLATLRELRRQGRRDPRATDPRVVVASGDCYIGLLAYRLARRLHARFVFDIYDKYDEFVSYRRLPRFDPFSFLRAKADHRLFASRSLMENLHGQPGRDFVVPNGIDTERFRPMDRLESRRSLGLPDDTLLVGYFGSMEPDRGIDDLIAAVLGLRCEGMLIELLLGGRKRDDLELPAAGVRYVGNVPFERMPAMLASCDLLSVPYRRSALMDAGASNKIAEAIACGRPLVATRTPNFMSNFPEQAMRLDAVLATPGDPVDLARVIRAQAERPIFVEMPTGMDWASISDQLVTGLGLAPEPAARAASA